MVEIPTLQTDRLVLRAATIDDWPEYCRLMTSDRSIHMGGPYSVEQSWGWFCQDVAQWQLFGLGSLMIEERISGRCLGQVGINSGPLFPEHELGWMLYAGFEGNGYAFEAAQAFRDWAFLIQKLDTLVSYVGPCNHRSRALAERLGAKLDADAKRPESTDLVYRHING